MACCPEVRIYGEKCLYCDRGPGHLLSRTVTTKGRKKLETPEIRPGWPHRAMRHEGVFTWDDQIDSTIHYTSSLGV